jgi:hypothetical protein
MARGREVSVRYVTHDEFQSGLGDMGARFERALTALREDLKADRTQQDSEIRELVRSRQISWPLVVSIISLLGTLGMAGVAAGAASWTRGEQTARDTDAHAQTIGDFRDRIRGLETALRGIATENESQNRWAADVENLQSDHQDRLIRTRCTVDAAHPLLIPPPVYQPLSQIGRATLP